ncbi:DUF1702 family protein [Streptomyces sp. NPDC042319]|uniref:DUF1702 family protein n=1 Tax=Streptomyces sp. NPDC042319 TaxID=3154332 RepID=UPI0033DD10B7
MENLLGDASAVQRSRAGLTLPSRMADFSHQRFRTDCSAARAILERHARSFLLGFDLAVAHWRAPHEVLREVPDEERGFAYEGAGMFAGLVDLGSAGRANALARLLAGEGDCYAHLVHVGAGWLFTMARLPALVRLPGTPLLRWLAADGCGFGEVYFGGLRALRRRAGQRPSPRWEARLAGNGRALWFVECADPAGIAAVIEATPAAARPHLWSGVGLAAAYAGAVDDAGRQQLVSAAGATHQPFFLQGVTFAAGARVRAGVVPDYTERACTQLLGVDAARAAQWTDQMSADLLTSREIGAYREWKARLRRLLADRS